jgi:hypothetical protein
LPQPALSAAANFFSPHSHKAREEDQIRPILRLSQNLPDLLNGMGSPVSGTAQYLRMLAMTFGMVAMMSGSGSQGGRLSHLVMAWWLARRR